MKQIRYLKPITLYKATKVKQPNGAIVNTNEAIKSYFVSFQELTDEISATLYGAKLNSMYRISSVHYELESYLQEKNLPISDNSSDYFLVSGVRKYRITAIKEHWLDIEFIGTYGN